MDKLTSKKINKFAVPSNQIAVWWLGQTSYIIKSPSGITIALDPYLSDYCGPKGGTVGLNCHRMTPSLIDPADLIDMDMYIVTHSHEDHLDPETFKEYLKAGGEGPFMAPFEASEKMVGFGAGKDKVIQIWPNKIRKIGDMEIRATFAIPYGGDDLNHVGYIISVTDGPKLYFTGDTAYHEVLGISVAEHKPDVMFTVINGAFRNMGPADAAKLAKDIMPRKVIPSHYDLFPDGRMYPSALKVNLRLYDMQDRYMEIEKSKPYLFGKD